MPEVTNFVEVARGASGYQKKEFAEFLEVDPQTYRKIESDPDNMTLGMVKSLLPKLNRYGINREDSRGQAWHRAPAHNPYPRCSS